MTGTMFTLAFDPGPHTGCALFSDGTLVGVATYEGTVAQVIEGIDWYFERLAIALKQPHSTGQIVIEDFLSPGMLSRDGKQTIRYSGYIQGQAVRSSIPVTFQVPPFRKPFLDVAARALKYWTTPTTRHAHDAAAHGYALLAKQGRYQNGVH